MITRNKRKRLAKAFALSLGLVMGLSNAGTILAEAGTDKYEDVGTVQDNGTADTPDGVVADSTANQTSIDVNALVSGDGAIVYSVTLEWGDMNFEYDYGSRWDPTQHKYVPGTSGKQGGGWNTTKYVDGTNNKISVTNDSNYPINAAFAYTSSNQLNATTSTTSVKGEFNTNNATLVTNAGNSSYSTSGATETGSMDLEMCDTGLVAGDTYYYKSTASGGAYEGNMFFSFVGKPDRGLGMTTATKVGSIIVTISPATGVTQATK